MAPMRGARATEAATAAQEEPMSARGPGGIGIVGCGFVAREHHAPAIAAAGLELVAVADRDPDAAAGLAARTGADAREGLEQLLDDERIGTIAICTPPASHRPLAVAALEAGRDVLVEKPLALSAEDCEAIIAARDRGERIAAVGFNLRCHAGVQAARRAREGGALGRVQLLTHTWAGPPHDAAGSWATDPGEGGHLAFERGSHCLDLARHLLGAEFDAAVGVAAGGVLSITLRSDGAVASIEMVEAPAPLNSILLCGTVRSLAVDLYAFDGVADLRPGQISGALGVRVGAALRAPTKLPAAIRAARANGVFRASYTRQWEAFAEARAQGALSDSLASLEDGLATAALAQAAVASAGSGRPARPGAD